MAKRYLTDQQKRRITQAHEETRQEGDHYKGLVIESFGKRVLVENGQGPPIVCHVKTTLGTLVVGDRVGWEYEINKSTGMVLSLEPRHQLLTRPDHYKQTKLMAANIDQIWIVSAAQPEPIPYYIDKFLVAAELQGIRPFLVINKTDLVTPERLNLLKTELKWTASSNSPRPNELKSFKRRFSTFRESSPGKKAHWIFLEGDKAI